MLFKPKKRFWLGFGVVTTVLLAVYAYVQSNPLVFNESFFEHAHCIAMAGMDLRAYATAHEGKFPWHKNGYCEALLLLENPFWPGLTGPGYHHKVFLEAKSRGLGLPESACGRVYIQGLTLKSDQRIVLLFDKLPTPGGDHCHLFGRIFAPLGREVLYVDGSHEFVEEARWRDFARGQVELLVNEGFSREAAEGLYAISR